MSTIHSRLIGEWFSYIETEENIEAQERFERLASGLKTGKLLTLIRATLNEFDPIRASQLTNLLKLNEFRLTDPSTYYSKINNISLRIIEERKNEINTNNELLHHLLDIGKDPNTDFGQFLAFFPSIETTQMNALPLKDTVESARIDEKPTQAPDHTLESAPIETPNQTKSGGCHDTIPEIALESLSDHHEPQTVIDQLFEILTTNPLKNKLIEQLNKKEKNRKTNKKTKNKQASKPNHKTIPNDKIVINLKPELLFYSLSTMMGTSRRTEIENEQSSVCELDLNEGIELLKNWMEKIKESAVENPHLYLFSFLILNQLVLACKDPKVADLHKEILKNVRKHDALKNIFSKHVQPIEQKTDIPNIKINQLVKNALLRATAQDPKTIHAIHSIVLNESNRYTIKETIDALIRKNEIESLARALLLYDLNKNWISKDKNFIAAEGITIKIFLLLDEARKQKADNSIKKFTSVCGDQNESLMNSMSIILDNSKETSKTAMDVINMISYILLHDLNPYQMKRCDPNYMSKPKINLLLNIVNTIASLDIVVTEDTLIKCKALQIASSTFINYILSSKDQLSIDQIKDLNDKRTTLENTFRNLTI